MSKTKNRIIPDTLKKGDRIAIIATARKIYDELLDPIENILKGWGLIPVRGANLFKEHNQFSGTDDQRRSDLQWAMDDPDIKAVLCFRGGYGTVRILDGLKCDKLCQNPKWFIGYSDVTALHQFINTQANMASIHGTMAINFTENTPSALASLKTVLLGQGTNITFDANSNNTTGEVTAQVIGGNLAILQSLMGTPYEINTNGKILFIEDVDEYLYNIDRIMWTLKLSKKLDQLAGLIVGGMTEMNDHEIPFGASPIESIIEKVSGFSYPVCFDFPAGHIKGNMSFPLGQMLNLKVTNEKVYLKSVVS